MFIDRCILSFLLLYHRHIWVKYLCREGIHSNNGHDSDISIIFFFLNARNEIIAGWFWNKKSTPSSISLKWSLQLLEQMSVNIAVLKNIGSQSPFHSSLALAGKLPSYVITWTLPVIVIFNWRVFRIFPKPYFFFY